MGEKGTRNWNPREESNHRNSRHRIPGVVRKTISKIWPGKRSRKGKVTK